MRSRYTAYVAGNSEYLLATWEPMVRPDTRTFQLQPDIQWRSLKIVNTQTDKEAATVEFIAVYTHANQYQEHHEVSRFKRIVDDTGTMRWYYSGVGNNL